MTTPVAGKASTSSEMSRGMAVQEKGSRNKRKFRADTPLTDPNKSGPEPQGECPGYITAEKFEDAQSPGPSTGCETSGAEDNSEALKLDLGLSCAIGPSEGGSSKPKEEKEAYETFDDADWNDLTEYELEELVMANLDSILKNAIKNIVACGYSEEVATKAVSKAGQCFGTKDAVSNIVETTLAYLRGDQEIGTLRDYNFEDFPQLGKYMLAELVCILKAVNPSFSTGAAMWCLLVCDLNVSQACLMEADQMSSMVSNAGPNGNSSASLSMPSRTESDSSETNFGRPVKTNPSIGCSNIGPSEATDMASNPYGHTFESEAPTAASLSNLKSKVLSVANQLAPEKDCPTSLSATGEKTFSLAGAAQLPISEEKFVGSRKVSGISKIEYILRQKSLHLEKHYRTSGSKGASRTGKLNSFGGLVLDKKLKSLADSTGVNTRSIFKIGKATGAEVPQDNVTENLSANIGFPSVPATNVETDNTNSKSSKLNTESSLPTANTSTSLLTADTELSLSLPAKSSCASMPVNSDSEVSSFSDSVVPMDKTLPHWVPEDKKAQMIMKRIRRVRELQSQLQEWTEWANQKVMQAARRLSKDKAELKALKQEKEEVERLKKEKQVLEENTMKKLSEMENALFKASGQVERANAAVRRLEVENAALRREMEAAKSRATETAASCEEVSKREKANMMKFQSLEKRKAIYQEELAAEKCKSAQLKQRVKQADDLLDQLEARWKQESKAKEEFLAQVSSLTKERDHIEASVKSKEDTMKSKAENNLQKHKDEILKLDKEISKLKLKADFLKIDALKRGIDESYASRLADFKNTITPRESHIPYISKVVTDFEDYSGSGGVKRERECVMCLSEEMSVVFLPCAHQVVCTTCNELHKKQGMEDCPSCRSPIQQRICVRYVCS